MSNSAGSSESADSSGNAEFINKAYRIVNHCHDEKANVCSWSDEGDSFIIRDQDAFTDVLPHYFRHKNFRSFVRQLNFYGFHKIKNEASLFPTRPVEWSEFKHDHFKKGKPKLLSKIKRVVSDLRKQALDSSLKPKKETRGTANDGADNNEDLRSDVAELRSQVEDLKNQVSGLLVVLTHLVPGFSPLTMTGVQPAGAPNEHKDREEDEQTSSGGKGGRRKPQSQSQKRTSKRLRTGEESHISLSPPTLPASSSSSAHDAVHGNGGKSHHTGERVSLEGLPLNHPLASRGGQTTSLDILKEAIGGGDQALSLQALQQQVSLPGSMISFGPMSGLSALGSLSMGFNSGGLEVLGNIAAVSSGTGSSSQRQSTRGTGTSSASSRAAATPELGARERAKQIEKRLEGVPLAKIRQPSSRGKK